MSFIVKKELQAGIKKEKMRESNTHQ